MNIFKDKLIISLYVAVILVLPLNFVLAENEVDLISPDANVITIKSASEYDYPPFSVVDGNGQADGFSIELLKAALGAVGWEVEFYTGTWDQIKDDLANGRIQVLPLVGRTPEREAIFDFTVPYITLYGAIFVRSGETGINSVADLQGKQIVVMAGDNAEEYVRRENLSDSIITTNTFEEAFKLLSAGQYDAVVTQKVIGSRLLAMAGIENIVVAAQLDDFRQDFTFAVKDGDREMLSLLNEGLSKIIANGTFDTIYDKWLVQGLPAEEDRYGYSEMFPSDPVTRAKLIFEYDRSLTDSSYNYILTGDVYWKNNYDEIGKKLDILIKAAKDEAKTDELKNLFAELNDTNLKLVQIELKAHELVKEDKKDEAKATIDSQEYKNWKVAYANLINNYFKILGVAIPEDSLSYTFAKDMIRQKAEDVARQIEIYLEAHPEMTVKDLQTDPEFQELAVQKIGQTGYTFVYDYDTMINLFDEKPEFVGLDYTTLKDEPRREEWWAITEPTRYGRQDAAGTYQWQDPDGVFRDKYKYTRIIQVKTADGVGLALAASTYLDEYENSPNVEDKSAETDSSTTTAQVNNAGFGRLTILVYWIGGILILLFLFIFILNQFKIIYFERKKILYILILALVVMIGLFALNTYQTTETMKRDRINFVVDRMSMVAVSRKNFIQFFIDEQKEKIHIAATQQDLTDDELKELLGLNDELEEVFVMDSAGIVTSSSDQSSIGSDRSAYDYFIEGKKAVYIKPVFYYSPSGKAEIYVSTPFHGGVLATRLNTEPLNEIVADFTGLGGSGESLLAFRNDDGDAVFFTDRRFSDEATTEDEIIPKENEAIPITQALLKNEKVYMDFKDYRNVPVIAVTGYIDNLDIGLVAKMDTEEALAPVINTINKIWQFTVGIILSIIIIGIIFVYLLTNSLKKEVEIKTREIRNNTAKIKEQLQKVATAGRIQEQLIKEQKLSKKELENKIDELEKFQKLTIDRELKMIELKKKIKDLGKNSQS